jgi:hypothetical protein
MAAKALCVKLVLYVFEEISTSRRASSQGALVLRSRANKLLQLTLAEQVPLLKVLKLWQLRFELRLHRITRHGFTA